MISLRRSLLMVRSTRPQSIRTMAPCAPPAPPAATAMPCAPCTQYMTKSSVGSASEAHANALMRADGWLLDRGSRQLATMARRRKRARKDALLPQNGGPAGCLQLGIPKVMPTTSTVHQQPWNQAVVCPPSRRASPQPSVHRKLQPARRAAFPDALRAQNGLPARFP